MEYLDPDAIMGNESWLNSSIKNSEIFPHDYAVYRKDRTDSTGSGAFIAVKDTYLSSECMGIDSNCEIVWASVQITGAEKLKLGQKT